MIYRKTYMDKIIPFIDTPFVKILTGVRRCGKSTVMEMIKEELLQRGISKENIISYRFDSLENEEIDTASKLYKEIKRQVRKDKKMYIFLDEIQEVKDWEKAANSFLSDFGADVYVTGSNSRMMSSEISTYLTGRYVSFRIYPLSFSEYLEFRKTYADWNDIYSEFARYIRFGGFPALQLQEYSLDSAYTVVRDIYNSTIFTDIVKRSQIRKIDQLERIVKYTFSNTGQPFSALSLSKYLKSQNRSMDPETVYNYLSKLESAYILHRCSRFDIRGKEILKTQEKFYLADPAFRFAVLGFNEDDVASTLENIVFLELKHRGYDVYVGKLDQNEIDFVAVRQNEKLYIQIAQEISSEKTKEREYGNLLSIADNYPKYVLRTDILTGGNHEGIKTMHVADFLLSGGY
ncbi:MAG: ATP-binding protein [Oscillospiraceae bacterium]|nr:ATP-binding protein [Oscillospiraceae bacterium]